MFLIKEFRHLKLKLEDITSATDNFGSNKLIGRDGFGLVYKGELSLPEGRSMVAFKRLDRKFGQGNTEFWKEILMLSKYKHENLISLLHFCIEGDERILVYEYASRGSLDRYLSDASLTWMQRLKICVGVARALNYLHDPMETQQRVLHRDVKSSNILLDEKWNAKVSDFGLSKVGLANQPQTYLVSNVVGTFGYCDPLYIETGFLSKESDVYSFGVVLFEVMCGKLCCEYHNDELLRVLVPTWKKCFVEKRLDDIICHDLKGQIDQASLKTFSTIANRCLNRDHKKRPTMVEIVKQLEVALKQCLSINNKRKSFGMKSVQCLSINENGESSGMISKGAKARKSYIVKSERSYIPVLERKEKVGERITALQQLVSPSGKADTASVLLEAMEYILFLHEQVKVLSAPYLHSNSTAQSQELESYNLKSKGLRLVPISFTMGVASSNEADIWAPFKESENASSENQAKQGLLGT